MICFVVSGLLAVTHAITQPVIDANAKKEADASRIALLPEADAFTQVEYSDDVVSEVWAADNGAGYVITGSAKGYGGDVPVMVGIHCRRRRSAAIQVMDNDETPGVGKKVMESSTSPTCSRARPGRVRSRESVARPTPPTPCSPWWMPRWRPIRR